MSPLLLIPLLFVAQTRTRWEASVRTEVRARSATAQDTGTNAAGDGELRPRLGGGLVNGRWSLDGSYSPILRTREPYLGKSPGQPLGDHSHLFRLDGAWAKEGTARAFAGQFVNYGTLDLSTLNREPATGTGPAPLPQVQPVRTGLGLVQELTSDTTAGVAWYFDPRLTLTTTAGFIYGGGADELSRRSLPLQSSPRVASGLVWLASVRDTIGLHLGGQYIRFFEVAAYDDGARRVPANPGARIGLVELSGNYARQLAPRTAAELTVGLTGTVGQVPNPDPLVVAVYREASGVAPLASAGFTHRQLWSAQQLDLRLRAQYSPYVDRFAGTVYQRVETSGAIGWSNAQHFSAGLSSGVGRSIPAGQEPAVTTLYGEAAGGYQGDPWWRVDLVGRLSVVSPEVRLSSQWVVGVSLTLLAASAPEREVPREDDAEDEPARRPGS